MVTAFSNYRSARNHIQDGDIVFVRDSKGFIAKIIQWVTHSHYSHVGIAFWMESGGIRRLMVVEAQGGTRRRIVNLSKYDNVDLDIISAPTSWESVVDTALERLSEVPYGYFEALYVGTADILQQHFNITLPRKNFGGEICSEYVARIYNLPEKHVSPGGLMKQLAGLGYTLRTQVKR